jgi:hypothetical protein
VPVPPRRLVYVCDWLPPDYGAVGQYATIAAEKMAVEGYDVVLGGLTTGTESETNVRLGAATLRTVKIRVASYEKRQFVKRLLWTASTNTRLLYRLFGHLRRADDILFTGSPPLLLHWIAPLNLILRKRLIYRITDFHPECLMAASAKPSLILNVLYRLTLFWRRRVDAFEVLGEDQRVRLEAIGIPSDKISLKRDTSPVPVPAETKPLPRDPAFSNKLLLLYSGNWGVAHDVATFLQAYRQHHQKGSGRFVLWLNAVGANADNVAAALQKEELPFLRTTPVPIDTLARLLVTPDAHLITLRDEFVGYVLPSKVYGCVASGRPIFYVGSAQSDVHLLCNARMGAAYLRVDVGAVNDCAEALEKLADHISPRTVPAVTVAASDRPSV